MDNQHTLIKGYRDLPQETIDLMNRIKEKEREVLDLISQVSVALEYQKMHISTPAEHERFKMAEPNRWLAIGKTDIQTGFMAIVRSVAQPLNL